MKKMIKTCILVLMVLFTTNVFAADCNDPNNLEVNCVYDHVGIKHYSVRTYTFWKKFRSLQCFQ